MTLKIEDLDEFEGLTADMVRAWMVAHGWEYIAQQETNFTGCVFKREGEVCWLPDWPQQGESARRAMRDTLDSLAHQARCSVQFLLREINPRMRAGWPTDEELERHAFWMVRTLSDDGIRVLGAYVAREWKKAGIKVECWPCDQHGNKTRRGA